MSRVLNSTGKENTRKTRESQYMCVCLYVHIFMIYRIYVVDLKMTNLEFA